MTLHLVRRGASIVAKPADWVVDLDALVLHDRGTPPVPPGPVTHADLLTLIVRADLVITW